MLSRTVSEFSQHIVQIFETAFSTTLWGLRDNVRCSSWAHRKARMGLTISGNWTFFARCYGSGDMSENRSKIGDFAPTRSVWLKISDRRGRLPPIIFARIVRPMNALQHCRWQVSKSCTLWLLCIVFRFYDGTNCVSPAYRQRKVWFIPLADVRGVCM